MDRPRFGLRRFHRWLGVVLLLPLLLLVATGILLNHTETLGLDRRHAGLARLAALYGIRPQAPETGFPVGDRWVSHAHDTVFVDARGVDETAGPLLGAAQVGNVLVVATPQAVSLYMMDGRRIDTLGLPAEAGPATAFALLDGHPGLATPQGVYRLDSQLAGWVRVRDRRLGDAVEPQPLPAGLRANIANRLASTTLSWERVLLDLHSGRLFGRLGPWLIDFVAVAVAALAVTGCILWLRMTRARRRRTSAVSRAE